MASSESKSLPDPSACSDTKVAMAERPFSILKVIVAAQFFSSCYFKVELLHSVTLSKDWK